MKYGLIKRLHPFTYTLMFHCLLYLVYLILEQMQCFSGKLGIFRISKDLNESFEDVNPILSPTMFFKYDFLFFHLMDFDHQLVVTLEKQMLYLFFCFFVVVCSNSLFLLKSIIANWLRIINLVRKNIGFLEPICCRASDMFPKFLSENLVWYFRSFKVFSKTVTVFSETLNGPEYAFNQSVALNSFFVWPQWQRFLILFPVLHLCLSWMWNKTLSHFSRNNSSSPSSVTQTQQKCFELDLLYFWRTLHDFVLLTAANLCYIFCKVPNINLMGYFSFCLSDILPNSKMSISCQLLYWNLFWLYFF